VNKERLNPLNDYLFLKYMGEKSDEEQLLAFLNAVLKKTGKGNLTAVKIIEDKTITPEIIGNKKSILDLRAKINTGAKVNIEVQLCNLGNMDRRGLFYWSREYAKGIRAGQDYQDLPGVIAINIIDFEFIAADDFHTSFHLWEDSRRECLLTEDLEIHFIDMVKFRRLPEKDITNNPLHRWLTFFDKHADNKTIEEVINMDTAIQKAPHTIDFVRSSDEDFRAYQMRELAMCDYTNRMNQSLKKGHAAGLEEGIAKGMVKGHREGLKEGIEKGMEKGREESFSQIILNLYAKGMSRKDISDLINMPVKQVRKYIR
jgi:predicted transposase/invertase (TIGR01784 family)